MSSRLVKVIIGPTASGKSALALSEAEKWNGVIINCDAMQSYDALHTLTAQPDTDDLHRAPHRLYGHLHPAQSYSAAQWRDDAIIEIENALDNGQVPIICGGTGFYLKALMEGLSPIPDTPDHIRAEAMALHATLGNPSFHAELSKVDPATAALIDPMNTQRNIRAWEVLQHTGRPLADWQTEPLIGPPDDWHFEVTAIFPNRDNLIQKINYRLSLMVERGIVDEVRALDEQIKSGSVPDNALIIKAHGFRPFRRYLNGECTMDEAIEHTQTETRQYAKRQMTWLRNQLSIDHVIEAV